MRFTGTFEPLPLGLYRDCGGQFRQDTPNSVIIQVHVRGIPDGDYDIKLPFPTAAGATTIQASARAGALDLTFGYLIGDADKALELARLKADAIVQTMDEAVAAAALVAINEKRAAIEAATTPEEVAAAKG